MKKQQVRILIVENQDYATGDIPFIEVTSQLSVFDVRCRKQVATNKELSDLALPEEERAEEGKVTASKTGATRLAPLVTAPWVLPAINTAVPSETGAWTATDIPGSARTAHATGERKFPLNTGGRYDPATDAWARFETPIPTEWRNMGVAVIEGDLYAVGGWDGSRYIAAVQQYQAVFKSYLPTTKN